MSSHSIDLLSLNTNSFSTRWVKTDYNEESIHTPVTLLIQALQGYKSRTLYLGLTTTIGEPAI